MAAKLPQATLAADVPLASNLPLASMAGPVAQSLPVATSVPPPAASPSAAEVQVARDKARESMRKAHQADIGGEDVSTIALWKGVYLC